MSDKTIPERESVSDMLGRLSRMSRGEPTWDLSDNDCAAIKWLLNERKASEAKVRELEQALEGIIAAQIHSNPVPHRLAIAKGRAVLAALHAPDKAVQK